MQPLSSLPPPTAGKLNGLLFDLDGTLLLDNGRLSVASLQALWDLHRAGFHLVGVTGRPAGWGQPLVRQWPIDAMLTENGKIGLRIDKGRIVTLDRLAAKDRFLRRRELLQLTTQLHSEFPGVPASDDVASRQSDYSFDIGESVALSEERIVQLARRARQLGAQVVRSSIQLHVSLDGDDKASGAVRLLKSQFATDETLARFRYAFIGDSDNDAPCFAAFHYSFGVASLSGRPSLLPRYQTPGGAGEGFCQLAQWMLSERPTSVAVQPSRN